MRELSSWNHPQTCNHVAETSSINLQSVSVNQIQSRDVFDGVTSWELLFRLEGFLPASQNISGFVVKLGENREGKKQLRKILFFSNSVIVLV